MNPERGIARYLKDLILEDGALFVRDDPGLEDPSNANTFVVEDDNGLVFTVTVEGQT